MGKSDEKWRKVAKSKGKVVNSGKKCLILVKSGGKCEKVGESWKKWVKVVKSCEKWGKWLKVAKSLKK